MVERLRYNERGNNESSKRKNDSGKEAVRGAIKKYIRAGAIGLTLTLGAVGLAGCAGKKDVKSANDTPAQEMRYSEMKGGIIYKPKNLEINEGYSEMKKVIKKKKAPEPKGSEIEAKEPNLFESESYEFNVGISTYNFITSTMLSGTPVYNGSFVGSEVKLKLNEDLSDCIKQAKNKCELTVKKDTALLHIETNNEYNDYMDLKVAKVDSKGIYLSLEMQLMGGTTQSGAEYYRINFGGEAVAIMKNGEEVSNEEVDHVVSKILSLVSFNAEVKPSEKEGEATLILYFKGYGEVKATKMKKASVMVGYDPSLMKMKKAAKTSEPKVPLPKISEPSKVKAKAFVPCHFEESKCIEKAYEGDLLVEMKSVDGPGPFGVSGINSISIEKVGEKEVELKVNMLGEKPDVKVTLKYGEKKEIGDEHKMTVMVKKTKKEDQVKFIIKQPKGYGELKKELKKNLIAPKAKGTELLDKEPEAYEKKE